MKPIRAADLFCGSGGFSTALVLAVQRLYPGRQLDMVAVNHWEVAIDTHQANHPGVRHLCADLKHVKPREAVPGGVLDLLLAAPTCTYYSRARGGRPVYDQLRMDPWIVVQWCTDLRVHALQVENVPEFVDWGPCDARTGKPLKSRKGEYFHAWIAALQGIGMRVEWRVLNCADFGDATTRERFFLMGRSDRKRLRWPVRTHAPRGKETDLLGTLETWRSAAEIIDWSRPGTSIFTRKRQLVKNTLSRLLSGGKKNHWPKQHLKAIEALIAGKKPRLKVTPAEAKEIARQLGIPLVMASGSNGAARGVDRPIPAMVTTAKPHFVRPIITPYYGGGSGLTGQSVDDPMPAQGTKDRFAIATPFLVPNFGERPGQDPRTHSLFDPVPAILAQGHIQIARPFVSLCTHGNARNTGRSVDEPIGVVTTAKGGEMTLATPALAEGYYIDILYRMLHWTELARATSFVDEGRTYHFTGNTTEITKQIGNAVPIRTGRALCEASLEAA